MNTQKYITLISAFIVISAPSAYAQKYTTLDCLIKPEMYIELSSPTDGVLESVLVNKADTIKKGQALAILNATVEKARVKVAQQETLLDNKIYAKKLKRSYALRKLKRIEGLYKHNASSQLEQDEAETELAIAKTDLAQIRLDKTKNEIKLLLVQAELELKTIKSPINGIVVKRYLKPGESVENQAILQLAKIDPLLVEVVAPANLFGLVKKGMSVEIRPSIPVNSSYKALVSIVDRIIDAASGSFSIRLALPNPDEKLVGGTKCIALFPLTIAQTQGARNNNSVNNDLPDDIKALLRD